MDKLLVASEYTEPSFFEGRIVEGLKQHSQDAKCGLLLITKRPEGCHRIVEEAWKLQIPVVIHCTVTGLAGTVLEPRLNLNWKLPIKEAGWFRNQWSTKDIVLRIDPLIPIYTTRVTLLSIVEEAKICGFKRCRVSVIDYYPHVRNKFHDLGLWYPAVFQVSHEDRIELLSEAVKICTENGMSVESCAESEDVPGLKYVGCANKEEWAAYGLDLGSGHGQRKECFCNTPKTDLLLREPTCPVNCLYCYWGKNR